MRRSVIGSGYLEAASARGELIKGFTLSADCNLFD